MLAQDWPTWRFDAARSAVTPHPLPENLNLQWSQMLPPSSRAWPHDRALAFDAYAEPIVIDDTILVGSSQQDGVTALAVDDGRRLWQVFTDGPVRFAPAAWEGKLYVASDDGTLRCLRVSDGQPLWTFRAAPGPQTLLGNGRLISMWPVRGAPVVSDEKVYFAAGIWPFQGVFVYALDARSGEVVWVDEGSGSHLVGQPHGGDVLAGIAPQGYLAAAADKLIVPNGRACPAVFDRRSGRLDFFQLSTVNSGKGDGGYEAFASDSFFFHSGLVFDLATGQQVHRVGGRWNIGSEQLPDGGIVYCRFGRTVSASDLRDVPQREGHDRRGQPTTVWDEPRVLWSFTLPTSLSLHLKADRRLVFGRQGAVEIFELTGQEDEPLRQQATLSIEGTPVRMLAAAERLLVVTDDGRLHCFGAEPAPLGHSDNRTSAPEEGNLEEFTTSDDGSRLVEQTGVRAGYALVLGDGASDLAESLLNATELTVIAVEADRDRIERFRRTESARGRYGTRAAAWSADPWSFAFPPYVADLIVCADAPLAADSDESGRIVQRVYNSLRPYGGVACWLGRDGADASIWKAWLERLDDPGAQLRRVRDDWHLVRTGPIPGAADWTHLAADAANSYVSRDQRVAAPLGLLWFGGLMHSKGQLPPQVVAGRAIISMRESVRAIDIYTGRLLWETPLPGLGDEHDQAHLLLRIPDHPSWPSRWPDLLKAYPPEARSIGVSYVSLPDGIYVAYGTRCLRIEPASGRIVSEFRIPPLESNATEAEWGMIRIVGDRLIAAAGPRDPWFDKPPAQREAIDPLPGFRQIFARGLPRGDWGATSSAELVVLDRHSGELLWRRDAKFGFRHNAIAAGGDRVFAIDRVDAYEADRLKRRGEPVEEMGTLHAWDLETGRVVWERGDNVFGTALAYSVAEQVVVEAHDRWILGADRIAAYHASDGVPLWNREGTRFAGPVLLHGGRVITQTLSATPRHTAVALDLASGETLDRAHPLCDQRVPWSYERQYGCGPVTGSEHLLLFRSSAAGFHDLKTGSGTGNLGGFRTGCTPNLVAAGGLLNAPDMTLGCICNFHHQTSLAMMPVPDGEFWTVHRSLPAVRLDRQAIGRVGVNLGAAGDRRAESGTYWTSFPAPRRSATELPIQLEPDDSLAWFRRHSVRFQAELPWIVASGAEGSGRIQIPLGASAAEPRTGTVRLFFAEPRERAEVGQRIFNVRLQDRVVLTEFDIVRAAGGPLKEVVHAVEQVAFGELLVVELEAVRGEPILCGVEIIPGQ